MSKGKLVKDVMVDVFDFPHIPYWFSIRQAIGIIKKSMPTGEKRHYPVAVLVFDEKYNLLGTVGLKDILKGLEPKFLKSGKKAQLHEEDESELSVLWDTLFKESREAAERPVSDVMVPTKLFVKPEDPLTKAAYLMIHNEMELLPVLEDKKKFVGLVRMIEVFHELSEAVMTA
jgi:CBS-domain-containing membrane protein